MESVLGVAVKNLGWGGLGDSRQMKPDKPWIAGLNGRKTLKAFNLSEKMITFAKFYTRDADIY